MYLLEPILNMFYRLKMKSMLAFESGGTYTVPPATPAIRDRCLLYIHVPFCQSLCPYCSFHRYVYEEEIVAAYFEALWKELRMYRERGYDFQSIYVGGGTPTISLPRLSKTLDLARGLFGIREISVETNPNHLTAEVMGALKSAGVNRLSVGVQSFDDRVLQTIDRYGKYGSGAEIQDRLRGAIGQFHTLNVDMIFNMPTQDEASLRRDLEILDKLLPEQITFYPLMTAASVKAELARTLGAVSYLQEKKFYFLILEKMKEKYVGSTAWCFSRRSSMIDEYIVAYDHYAAAGSGAFGYLGDHTYANTFSLDEYIRMVNDGRFPIARIKRFDEKENIYYYFLMKLFGLSMDKQAFAARFGRSYERALWPLPPLLRLTGSVEEDERTVRLTDRGRYYWVMAMREFFIAVDTMRDHCRRLAEKK